jgi:pimeloyl-ACP methyl ester carboxylesterase
MSACDIPGPDPCGACDHARPLSLKEALGRFDREAVRGVCDTGRYRCSHYTWGQGPPLLLIPGLSDDALSFVMVSALLAGQFRCIAYNPPAAGADGARLGRYRHADLVEDAFALLDHLGVRQSYVFGSSFGSTVALAALAREPERLPRGILQGGFARRRLAPVEVLLASFARYWPGRQGGMPLRRAVLHRVHHGPFAGREPDAWEYFLERWGQPSLSATGHRARMLHRLDLRPILPRVRQPVLLVCGDRDPLVGRACEEELLRGLPRAVRVELSDCGHNPLFSHPEALAEVIRRFLTPPPRL